MKLVPHEKALVSFLFKLFIPGLLALPWLLNLYFSFIPKYREGYDFNYIEFAKWLEPLAYAGFAFGVIAPMFLLRKYTRSQKTGLVIHWGIILTIWYILMVDPLRIRREPFFADDWFIFLLGGVSLYLSILYFRMSTKLTVAHSTNYLRLHFLFHIGVQAMILLLCGIIFTEEFLKIRLNSLDMLDELGTTTLLMGILVIFITCATLATVSMCIASIRQFMKPEGVTSELIDEIGTTQ